MENRQYNARTKRKGLFNTGDFALSFRRGEKRESSNVYPTSDNYESKREIKFDPLREKRFSQR